MLYCDSCATNKRWPKVDFKIDGCCEICHCEDLKVNEYPASLIMWDTDLKQSMGRFEKKYKNGYQSYRT